jgi:hypothetical protein
MKVEVTKAITSHGVYYEAGTIVEMDDPGPYIRLYGWKSVTEPVKAATPAPLKEGAGVVAPRRLKKVVTDIGE